MKPENLSKLPRYRELKKLRDYFEGKQYDGRADWWTGILGREQKKVPLRERKPCIIYPLPKAAVQQVVRFTFGEGKWPELRVAAQEDGVYAQLALTDEEAAVLQKGLAELVENAHLKATMRALMARGLAERTAFGILAIKRGRFVLEIGHAQDAYPKFRNDDPTDDLEEVTWCYQFTRAEETDKGVEEKRYWFRRDVTREAYVDYEPVPVDDKKRDVEWGQKTETAHDFGFCPAIWVRNLSESGERGDIDGVALYDGLCEEFDALNFALSQRHRGIVYFGVPQPWETGVEPGDGPGAEGRTARQEGPEGFSKGPSVSSRPGDVVEPARRLAPDAVWSFEGPNVRLGLLETNGKAYEVATLHVEDVRSRLLEAMSVVMANADQFVKNGGDMNAKFLVLAFAPLLNLVAELRDATWWPHALRKLLSMMLRVLAKTGGAGLAIANGEALAAIVQRFEVEVAAPTAEDPNATERVWMLPKITPVWGDYFPPSNTEVQEAVKIAADAKTAQLVQDKTAVQYVAPYFGVKDIDEEIVTLRSEARNKAEEDGMQAARIAGVQAEATARGQAQGAPPAPPQPPAGPAPRKA